MTPSPQIYQKTLELGNNSSLIFLIANTDLRFRRPNLLLSLIGHFLAMEHEIKIIFASWFSMDDYCKGTHKSYASLSCLLWLMIKAVAGPIQIEGGRKVLREKKEGSEMGRPTIRGVSCLLQACTEAIIQNGHRFSLMLSTWTLDNHLAHWYHICWWWTGTDSRSSTSKALTWIQCKLGKQYLVKKFTLPWESNPGPTPIRGGTATLTSCVAHWIECVGGWHVQAIIPYWHIFHIGLNAEGVDICFVCVNCPAHELENFLEDSC